MATKQEPAKGNVTRTKLDFLYKEVLGDVTDLLERVEAVEKSLAVVGKQAQAMSAAIEQLPKHIRPAMLESGEKVAEEMAQKSRTALKSVEQHLQELSKQSASYASIAHQSAQRMARIALIIGSASGALGGLLAGLAMGQFLT